MIDQSLPTFEATRARAYALLGRADDELRSDFARGRGPTDPQREALHRARVSITAAKRALDQAVRR